MERLQKFIARCGVASRRKAEEMIKAGEVKVNGEVVRRLGVKIDPNQDRVSVRGRELSPPSKEVYLLLNKPKGYITTAYDPQGRPTALDLVRQYIKKQGIRLFPVGRLDLDTTGLLLLTNDGRLAQALAHPSRQVEKVYNALVKGAPNQEKLKKLSQGIVLADGPTSPARVAIKTIKEGNAILEIAIHEGRKRQVRRMCQTIGHPVIELERVAIGPLFLGGLAPGEARPLTDQELQDLRKVSGLAGEETRPVAQRREDDPR